MAELQAIYHIVLIIIFFSMGCGILIGLFALIEQMMVSYYDIKNKKADGRKRNSDK